jgi:hypothetical protein
MIRVTMPDSTGRSIITTSSEKMISLDEDDVAIHLTYGVEVEAIGGRSIFDLAKRQFSGVEDRLTHELRNFLRRRGIRFRPYA